MAKNPKEGKLLYHLTDFKNLESILSKGLLPRKDINFNFYNVADDEILKDRKKFDLSKYTPFHFFSPTPFSGAVQKGNKKSEFIYIAIKRKFAEENEFKIIPSHPLNYDGSPLEWKEGYEKIDWDLLAERDYSNRKCKEVCMAECLFEGKIEPENFSFIFVKTVEMKSKVEKALKTLELSARVNVNTSFFIKEND